MSIKVTIRCAQKLGFTHETRPHKVRLRKGEYFLLD